MRKTTLYEVTKTREVDGNILADQEIRLSSEIGQACPITLRRILFVRKENGKQITLISNDLKRNPEEISALYKQY